MNVLRRYRIIIVPAFYLLIMIILTVVVSGKLSRKTISYMYYNELKTPSINIEYIYTGNSIKLQKNIISTSYNSLGTSREEAQKNYVGLAKKYKKIKGIKTNITFEQSVIYETIIIDYEKISNKDLSNYQGPIEKGELPKSKPVNLKVSEETLVRYGFIDSASSFKLKEKKDN